VELLHIERVGGDMTVIISDESVGILKVIHRQCRTALLNRKYYGYRLERYKSYPVILVSGPVIVCRGDDPLKPLALMGCDRSPLVPPSVPPAQTVVPLGSTAR